MPVTQSVLSLQDVLIPVSAFSKGLAYDPSADVVSFAFLARGVAPVSGDWKTGSWEVAADSGVHYAVCLVGPGGTVALSAGTYVIWVRVSDNPEVPIAPVDTITIQ